MSPIDDAYQDSKKMLPKLLGSILTASGSNLIFNYLPVPCLKIVGNDSDSGGF